MLKWDGYKRSISTDLPLQLLSIINALNYTKGKPQRGNRYEKPTQFWHIVSDTAYTLISISKRLLEDT